MRAVPTQNPCPHECTGPAQDFHTPLALFDLKEFDAAVFGCVRRVAFPAFVTSGVPQCLNVMSTPPGACIFLPIASTVSWRPVRICPTCVLNLAACCALNLLRS